MRFCALILLFLSLTASAVERVSVCFNYGCLAQSVVEFSDERLAEVSSLLESISPEQHLLAGHNTTRRVMPAAAAQAA